MKVKSIILVLFIVCVSSASYSQTNKGNWIVSGSSTLQVTNNKFEGGDDGATTVILSPSIGYFVANNLSLGVAMTLMTSEGTTAISVLPTASYYIETQSQLKPFIDLGIGYSSISDDEDTYGGLAIGAGVGIMYELNKNVGLNIGLQYLRSDYSEIGVANTIGGMIGFSIFF